MSKTIPQLMAERLAIHTQMKDLMARAETEGRSAFNKEEDEQFNRMNTDFDAKEAEISAIEQHNEKRKKLTDFDSAIESRSLHQRTDETLRPGDPKTIQMEERLFEKWARHGANALTTEERTILGNRYVTPEQRSTSGQTVGTDALGGYLVPDSWAKNLYEVMKWYGGAIEAGELIQTSSGGTLNYPTENDTANTGALITELTDDAMLDVPFGNVALGAFTYTSKIIKLSYELIQDEAYDIQGKINGTTAKRIGRITNTHFTTGNGTTQPQGLITGAGAGNTAADDTTISRADILDLIHSVDPAYRRSPKAALMFHDNTLLAIKKLSIGSNDDRPLWVPSMREGEPDKLEGHKYYINNDMATIAASAKAMVFGDFSAFIIRQVKGVTLMKLVERYAEQRAVGYIAHARYESKVVDNTAIKYMTMHA